MSNSATACPEVVARRSAVKVSGRAYAPKQEAARSAGSTPLSYFAPTREAHSTRCMSASEPAQLFEVAGHPAGDPGVYWRWPRRSKVRITSSGCPGETFSALKVEKTKSSGVLNLRASVSQLSGEAINAA